MAYLAHAIVEVLAAHQIHAHKAREAENRNLEEQAKQAKFLEDEKRIDAELMERDRAFHEAFPTDESQSEYFEQVLRRYPMLSVNGAALKNLAMCEWWNGRKELPERNGTF